MNEDVVITCKIGWDRGVDKEIVRIPQTEIILTFDRTDWESSPDDQHDGLIRQCILDNLAIDWRIQ